MRRFELIEGKSSKFWEVEPAGSDVNLRWGRIGTAGQSQTKSFDDEAKARAAIDKLVKEKTGKGYAEVTVAAGASIGTTEPRPATAAQAVATNNAEARIVTEVALAQPPTTAPGAETVASSKPIAPSPAVTPPAPAAAAPVGSDHESPPWLAGGDPVLLSPEMQRAAFPSRRFPLRRSAPDLRAAWLAIEDKASLQIDIAGTDATLRAAAQRLAERLVERTPAAGPAPDPEADTLYLSVAMTQGGYHREAHIGASVVDYLVAQYGLRRSVDLMLDALRIQLIYERVQGGQQRRIIFSTSVDKAVRDGWQGPIADVEIALRAYLSCADDADWQAARAAIEGALAGLHPLRQAIPAMLLPDAPDLSNALALRLAAEPDVPATLHWLLLTVTEPDAVAAALRGRLAAFTSSFWSYPAMTATVLRERGSAAWTVLERGAQEEAAGLALAAIGTPEAVAVLARQASASKEARARLALALDRWPLAGIAALAPLIASGGKDAGLLTPGLTRLLRAHGGQVDILRPWLDAAAQGVIDRQLAVLAGPAQVASRDELPSVLAAPPWLAAKQAARSAPLSLAPLDLAPVEQWDDAAREAAATPNSWRANKLAQAASDRLMLAQHIGFEAPRHNTAKDATEKFKALQESAAAIIRRGDAAEFVEAWHALIAERKQASRYFWFELRAEFLTVMPKEMGIAVWNAIAGELQTWSVELVMARFGLPALPGLLSVVRSAPTENFDVMMHYGAVELAPLAARAFVKLKTLREQGRDWLLAFPQHAAAGLIAPALGKGGEARDCAGSALRMLRANGHEALVLDMAGRYDDPGVRAALQAVFDEDPLDRFPTRRSKLPAFWQPLGWRRPVLHNGHALPDDALDHLGQMLTFPTIEEVYAGIDIVKSTCTAASLADFSWDCLSAWLDAGAPGKENWALTSAGLLGNDDTARRLTPMIRAWPGESAHARAATGLDVLAGIGSDVSLMLLNGIAQKVKFRALQDRAREKIDTIAQARGLSAEELEDRLAPDLGLDEQGTLLLDFGPRAFRVGFDETLKPFVREVANDNATGARLADLPKPKKTDDAALAKEAVERFKLLKKDVRTIASQQVARLEVAMCARRRWTPEVFQTFLAGHPLVRHLVQRLVWGVYEVADGTLSGGTLQACFRVAEDGTAATADDDTFVLPAGDTVRIGLPHALEIDPADAAAFGQLFADYELLQPFAQLGRDIYQLTDAERGDNKLERWKGLQVPTGKVLGLANKGWRRGDPQDGGCIWNFLKPLDGDRTIELMLEPGIIVGAIDMYPEQKLGEVKVGKRGRWGEIGNVQAFSTLDAIAASELVRDLEGLVG